MSVALANENELLKKEGANERLLRELGLRPISEHVPQTNSEKGEDPSKLSTKPEKRQEPFQRKPRRDPIGPDSDENAVNDDEPQDQAG